MEKGRREWATGFWHPRDFYKLDVLNSKMPQLQITLLHMWRGKHQAQYSCYLTESLGTGSIPGTHL